MAFKSYCSVHQFKSGKRLGGPNEKILKALIEELKDSKRIDIALYLFNNPILFDFLKSMARNGCKIRIVSLPLNGYSDRKLRVVGLNTKKSAWDFAEEIYLEAFKEGNIKLFIFPHMYSWYGALYAGGNPSYSFHVKAIMSDNGKSKKCIISSCNFNVLDDPKSENLFVIEDEEECNKVFEKFFNDVFNLSIGYQKYSSEAKNTLYDFQFNVKDKIIDVGKNLFSKYFFSAPFYRVDGEGSNRFAGNMIIDLIGSAKKRILACSQHFHDVSSFDPNAKTIFNAIFEKWKSNKQIEIKVLKQTPHTGLADKRRAAITETIMQFVMGCPQRYLRNIHDKFIIVDDKVLVCTANFTPTQFAWNESRNMIFKISRNEKYEKEGVFSEVNSFAIVEDHEVVKNYEKHFNELWEISQDIKISL